MYAGSSLSSVRICWGLLILDSNNCWLTWSELLTFYSCKKIVHPEEILSIDKWLDVSKYFEQLHTLLVLFRWTPVCWGALGCWIQPLSSAALRRTRFPQSNQHLRAPKTTWSSLVLSGPPTATSSWWLMTARSTVLWSKPDLYLQLSLVSCCYQTWTCCRVFTLRKNLKSCS